MNNQLQALRAQGFREIYFRCFPAGSAWGGRIMPGDWWFCFAHQPGSLNGKCGAGHTPQEALDKCLQESPQTVSASDAQYPYQVAMKFGEKFPMDLRPFTPEEVRVLAALAK